MVDQWNQLVQRILGEMLRGAQLHRSAGGYPTAPPVSPSNPSGPYGGGGVMTYPWMPPSPVQGPTPPGPYGSGPVMTYPFTPPPLNQTNQPGPYGLPNLTLPQPGMPGRGNMEQMPMIRPGGPPVGAQPLTPRPSYGQGSTWTMPAVGLNRRY
jgi:hypothetical protein